MEIINWCLNNLFLVSIIFNAIIAVFLISSIVYDNNVRNKHLDKLDRVVCAANRHLETEEIVLGVRHFDKLMHMQIVNSNNPNGWEYSEQGFVDSKGKFLTRREAHLVAARAEQIRFRCGGDTEKLYSENLY